MLNTQLVPIKEALISHLQVALSIEDFKYYQTTISVGDPAKGVVKFFKVNKLSPAHNIDYAEYLITIQIFIMFATNGADTTENMMLEWCGKLETAMHQVATTGLVTSTGNTECMGIKPSSRGIQFYSEEISATGRDRYEAWKGTVLAEYEFHFECNYL